MKLEDKVDKLPFVGAAYQTKLKKLNIETIKDLLNHVPNRYKDFRQKTKISGLFAGETVTVEAELSSIRNVYTKSGKVMQIAKFKDDTGDLEVVWFNQPYLVKNFHEGEVFSLSGKVSPRRGRLTLVSPEYEKVKDESKVHTGRLVPIYPETAGVSSKWLRRRIKQAFINTKDKLEEFLPENVLKKNDLPKIKKGYAFVHFPKTLESAEDGKRRLAFNELLFLHFQSIKRKLEWKKKRTAHPLEVDDEKVEGFINSLPFELTDSQKRSIDEILSDIKKGKPMNRLLEGDVGSGKTVVAAVASFVSFMNGYQTVFMAPTQILAEQHFNTLKEILSSFKVRVSLVTSDGVKADLGRTDVFVGTHALIHDKVDFENAALVVIDEQHRFGVRQRALLSKKAGKDKTPHILTMTATPIPRTVALTVYGDLDLSTLDELPKGRKPIKTWVVPPKKRDDAYDWLQEQIEEKGVQAFVICPLIEESDKELMKQVKAATKEYDRLKKILPNLKLGLLHGKLKSKEKNKVLNSFKEKKIDVLVSTPVVEVGIDVPNATIMIIEGAERFGLAQLHQLRGRVGRGRKKSFCLLFTESSSKRVKKRLDSLQKTMSGFELAELDLKLRGPGEVFGTKQHGFPELRIASWNDAKLIKSAKKVAEEAIKNKKEYKKLHKEMDKKEVVPN